jgi:uncharacterized protein
MENSEINKELKVEKQRPVKDYGPIFLGMLFFSVAFFISAYFISDAILNLRTGKTITVKGYAEMDIVSDFVIWSASISTTSETRRESFTKIREHIDKVMKYLAEKGIKSDSIELHNLHSNEIFEYYQGGGSRLIGYRFNQDFSVISRDLNKMKNLSNEINELVLSGITIASYAPQYSYTKLNDLKVQMLGEATKDARIRAEQIAKSGGSQISGIISASQGVFQITAQNSNEIHDYGINDVSSINKTIKSVVTVEFSVK